MVLLQAPCAGQREREVAVVVSTTRLAGRPPPPDYHHLNSSSIVMSSVDEKLDATETGYGSIKDEPKTGGGLKLIVIGMLIGAIFGVLGTMALITPHAPLAQFQEDCPDVIAIACSNASHAVAANASKMAGRY